MQPAEHTSFFDGRVDCRLFMCLGFQASREVQRAGALRRLLESGHQWRHRYNSLCDSFATGAGLLLMPGSSSPDRLKAVYIVSSFHFMGDILAWVAQNSANSSSQRRIHAMAMPQSWFLMHRPLMLQAAFQKQGPTSDRPSIQEKGPKQSLEIKGSSTPTPLRTAFGKG